VTPHHEIVLAALPLFDPIVEILGHEFGAAFRFHRVLVLQANFKPVVARRVDRIPVVGVFIDLGLELLRVDVWEIPHPHLFHLLHWRRREPSLDPSDPAESEVSPTFDLSNLLISRQTGLRCRDAPIRCPPLPVNRLHR